MIRTDVAEREKTQANAQLCDELVHAYWMELESVQNYLAVSANLDGVHGTVIGDSLAADVKTELGHAKRLAKRIHVLGGVVPCSEQFHPEQHSLQSSEDLAAVVHGVIDAEEAAIRQYEKIAEMTAETDLVTQNIVLEILEDEQEHRREFVGFLRDVEGE